MYLTIYLALFQQSSSMNNNYPENCIRGIQNEQNYITTDGNVSGNLFVFDLREPCREDGWRELSINWHDDDEAIDFTLKQKKNDNLTFKFQGGATLLKTLNIKHIIENNHSETFSYERKPLNDNKYHGNLLLKDGVSNTQMKNLAQVLAFYAEPPIPNPNC